MIRKYAALAAAAALLATGCGRTGVGVAARVGGTRILTSSLEARVTRGYANPSFAQQQPKADYQRAWLNRLITTALVKEAAHRLGVTIAEKDVNARMDQFIASQGTVEAFQQQAASQGIAKEDLHAAVRDLVLRDAVADKLVEHVDVTEAQLQAAYRQSLPRLDVAHIAHVVVATEAVAKQVAAQARAGADFAALAKKYSQDQTTSATGGDLGRIGNGEGKFEPVFEKAVFAGTRSGSVVGPIKARSGYEVIKVIERTTQSFASVRNDLRRAVIGQQREQRLGTYLTDLSKELGVTVNPRFGTWDPANAGVRASAGNDLSFPVEQPQQQQPPAPVGGP